MSKRVLTICGVTALVFVGVAAAASFHQVKPWKYDPKKTNLVRGAWEVGLGCPTNSKVTYDGSTISSFTDPACTTGDPRKDADNRGLLLVKTGPTGNYAAAGASLKDPPSTITELGYDLRKAGGDQNDPRGSHCGAGAPRFDIIDAGGDLYFLGCNSPAPVVAASSDGWVRLRWDTADGNLLAYPGPVDVSTLTIKSVDIVFDEAQDTGGPDNFGLAVLDNIDVNSKMVGR